MFATVFEWRLEPGREPEFIAAWEAVAHRLRARGSHGSALMRGDDGHYCAFARWPDRRTRDEAFAAVAAERAFAAEAAAAEGGPATPETGARLIRRTDLEEVSNLWAAFPAPGPAA